MLGNEVLHKKEKKAILTKSVRAPFFKGKIVELAKDFTREDRYYQFKIREDSEELAQGEFNWINE